MDLFNEAEAAAEINDTEDCDEIVIAAHKRKKRAGKKERKKKIFPALK